MKLLKLLTGLCRRLPSPLLSVAVLLLILWLTLAPHPVEELNVPLFEGADKVVHVGMFGFFALVMWFDCGRRGGKWHLPARRVAALCCLASAFTGVVIEYLQERMNLGRSFEWADMAADAAGCVAALLLIFMLRHR